MSPFFRPFRKTAKSCSGHSVASRFLSLKAMFCRINRKCGDRCSAKLSSSFSPRCKVINDHEMCAGAILGQRLSGESPTEWPLSSVEDPRGQRGRKDKTTLKTRYTTTTTTTRRYLSTINKQDCLEVIAGGNVVGFGNESHHGPLVTALV